MNRHISDFQNLGMLLLACFGVALIVCGILLRKTRFFDKKSEGDKAFPYSRTIGLLMLIVGAIVLVLSLLMLTAGG